MASADSMFINFEPSDYHIGSIYQQPTPVNGWAGTGGIPINPLIDQEITAASGRPGSFGSQSWRISSSYASGTFGDMPFSPSLQNEAGESTAQSSPLSGGVRQNHFEAKLAFSSADPTGPETDSHVSISPDRGDGARMSYIRLQDHPNGIEVLFDDYIDKAPYGHYGTAADAQKGCEAQDIFRETSVATGLSRNAAHTVRLVMDFLEGPRNDVVKVYVDGEFRFQGTSWEDYFRWCPESGGGTGNRDFDKSRTVDSLLFRVGGSPNLANHGKGYFIDNLSFSSSMAAEDCDNRHADGDGDVENGGGHGHMHFHKDGCGKHDGDNVEHDEGGHQFQSTSVDSATFSDAADGRTVTMAGTGVDNGVPVAFTVVAIDHDGLLPAAYSLTLTDGYTFIGTLANGILSVQ